ncbi:flap endonuclease GEN isoform X1 [Colias croceus]|uniref:flap endonuclease GEN isoform X1 n=3 Tax=Colias crocea TaxID=72248 RepID=UPI001E2801B2|nr:flap endonuclease GEN isoform X1 [Colias croceus]
MGIKGLWTVMSPYCEKKSLHEIRGETVAIDLSGWVCDSQNVTDYYIQPKLYLRNLFFRTAYLLLADITPIFVLEGDAPELKRDVMAARNAIQFRGAAPKSDSAKSQAPSITRKRFKGVLKECESLLKSMGVRCIKGRGEAEATCARLNSQGLVDAVVSQDSDCFAYGARRVYRNFSVSSSAGGGAMQGSVDCYDADKMFESNGFGRKKMIALAILCGCDYGAGACGSSITTVLSFLHTVPEDKVIHRLLCWVTDTKEYEDQERWVARPGRCDRCGHVGRTHLRSGCPVCATNKGCDDLGYKAKVAELKRELSLRSRALSCGMPFPEPKVMKEFLDATPDNIDLDAAIPQPSLIQFVKIMSSKLDWTERYCVEKFLPILTKWHLQSNIVCRTIKPSNIIKKRNPRGVPSYEVVWTDINNQYDALVPDDQLKEGEDISDVWTTTERQDLMRKYYPDVVESFEESIKKPPKVKKARGRKKLDDKEINQNKSNASVKPKRKYTRKVKKQTDIVSELNHSLKNLSLTRTTEANNSKLNVSVSVNKLKRKMKNNSKGKCKATIESYFVAKKKRKSNASSFRKFKDTSLVKLEYPDHKKLDDEKENINDKHLLNTLDMSAEEIPESDLSDIVDNIVKGAPTFTTAKLDSNLVKLVFKNNLERRRMSVMSEIKFNNNCSTPKYSPKKNIFNFSRRSSVNNANTSYFFDKLSERDAFEMSLEYKHKSAIIDADATVDYSLPDVHI